jgi:phospholipase/lecithinase/hemolysin
MARPSARVLRFLAAVTLFVVAARPASAQVVPPYDSLFVFGDSLADNGNDLLLSAALGASTPAPPSASPHKTYYRGRFSNGPVAFEYLWQRLTGAAPGSARGLRPFLAAPLLGSTGAVDFAFGGTGTPVLDQTPGGFWAPGLKGQVELFKVGLGGRKPSKNSLFVVVTGANDYRDDAFNTPMAPPDVVNNIADAVTRLYNIGARHIMVLSLPDLGQVPANRDHAADATYLSMVHNALLANAMNALSTLPKIDLMPIDINAVFGLLPASMNRQVPALAALFPPGSLPPPYPPDFQMAACLFIDPGTCADVPTFDVGDQFLFWDIVHPTTAAYKVLGDYLYQALAR